MALRQCTVSFRDPEGIVHTVEVMAETLFEAAALALHAFRQPSVFPVGEPVAGTPLEIAVRSPEVRHIVTVKKVGAWLQSTSRNPKEHAVKAKLNQMLNTAK